MPGPTKRKPISSPYVLSQSDAKTLDHIIYNPVTNLLEADRAIETTLNSLYLGEQHKMSSGSENIYFTNLTTDINFFPAWGGLKDQGDSVNQDMSGVIVPSGRVFTAYGVLPLGGNPVAGTQIAYDGDNYFPNNISGLGITTVVAEVVPANVKLRYELSVDGTPVYVQFLKHNGLGIDEPLSWTFDHPLDVNAGSTNHASITKVDENENPIGLLLVCQGDDGTGRYQTTVANRGYSDKNIAFTEDLESLDVVGFYDIYVDPTFSGTADGTNLRPYTTISEAISASSANNKIFVKGIVNVTAAVDLPHSLHFYGIDGSEIRYASYDAANGSIFTFTGTDYTQSFTFQGISFSNAGAYGLHLKKTGGIRIENCEFTNNGWSGSGLSTVLAAAGGALGYDSSAAELQAFYAGANASNGGAMRIEECVAIEVIGNKVQKNLRGIRIQDCGVGGYGFVTRNVASQNIESGIYIAAGGTYGGSQNIIVTMNSSAYNANNGLLVIGGLNNKFSQNEVNGNWNAGFCAWGAANSTLRDCGLYDNNRSQYNGIGGTSDAKASIQINESFSRLGNTISLNPDARFIAEILDTQVHYTGLGSNTEKIGFLITSDVGALADDDKNIIKVDDVGFIGQDYAIDLSEVDVTNLRLSLGDNSYQTIGVAAVKPPLSGNYSELPFSNHVMSIPSVNIEIDVLKQMVSLREYVSGNVINTYKANELQSVEHASHINIIQRNSDKIQLRGLTLGNVYVNGVAAGNTVNSMNNTVNAAFAMDLTEYKDFLVSEVGIGDTLSTWYYIESPDGVYIYPLFNNEANAQTIDAAEGGTGAASGFSFPDEPTGATWYGPDTSMVTNGSHAPSHGVYGNSTNIIWNEIPTNADSTAAPTPFTDAAVTLDELAALNFQIHPLGATFTTTIQSAPAWISQATANANATGTAPAVSGDNTSFPSVDHTLTVVRTNAYGSSTGTLTITVNNLTTPASLPGTLHAGSIVDSSATNSAGKIYLQATGGHVVYDFPTALADGDKLEWYHQDGNYVFGIAAAGVDKTTDLADHDADNSAKWDLAAPITGSPTYDNGQNFGNNFSTIHIGMVPLGWDDNTNPQTIPTRPVYASSDVWKLYNNAGTIELSLNGVLFRSSSSTHTDPVITFAVSEISGSGGVVTHTEMPAFTHTADQASAPTGFTLLSGTMDTSDKLNGNSAVSVNNLTLSPGQRLIATKAWWNTNVLPFLNGASGEDNKVFLGVAKDLAGFDSIVEQDFYASHRVENQTANLTKITQYYAGPTPAQMNINRSSDTDVHYNMAIEFTREGDLVTMRSPDTDPSLTTEPVGGTFAQTQTWTGAHAVVGTGAQDIVLATKEAETRVKVVESGLSVITAPSKANEFDVTEDTFSAPLFNGDPAGDITLAAGSTYKFWMHSSSIESTDALQVCLISDNSVYSTGVTTVGTPGSFGAYVEFAIPADVPPVKFKWTSGGSAYYVTPVVSGSTYSVDVTGITLEGPAANQTSTNLFDAGDHGWLSIDEPLGAGQRLVLSGAFMSDVAAAMADNSIISFGVKDTSWANTISAVVPSGFEGGMRISIYRASATNFQLYGYNGDTSTLTTTLAGGTLYNPSQFLNYNAFLEVTSSGNNVRVGYALTSTHDANTINYSDWSSTTKIQSGDQGYGISNADVMVQGFAVSGSGSIDASDIDWTALSEIAIPAAAPTITTDWNKAVDFSGSNERIVQVNNSVNFNAIRMSGSSTTVGAPSAGYTSSSTAARPWACVVVFKSDRHSSNQHIWNSGEGASTNNDNIFLRQDSSGNIYFSWGREGIGYNECRIAQTISSSTWYGVYIASNGTRLSGNNASASNLASAFDIRLMSSADSFASVGSNLSTSANWIGTGSRMDRSVTGSLAIGGRGSNRNFHGKISSMVVTTLRTNVLMPADSEIKLMITDPKKWEDDHLDGQTIRYAHANGDVTYNPSNTYAGYGAVQIWLMGDGVNDSYSNGIRNQVYSTDQNYTKLQFNSMSSNDIETVTIPGLT